MFKRAFVNSVVICAVLAVTKYILYMNNGSLQVFYHILVLRFFKILNTQNNLQVLKKLQHQLNNFINKKGLNYYKSKDIIPKLNLFLLKISVFELVI